jgi:Transposase
LLEVSRRVGHGVAPPWRVTGVRFDEASKVLTVRTPCVKLPDGSVHLVKPPSCHDYITLAADARQRRVLAVTEGRQPKSVAAIAAELAEHGCPTEQIAPVSIDMSPAFIKGCTEQLPNARITFDKFHVVWHATAAVDKMRRATRTWPPTGDHSLHPPLRKKAAGWAEHPAQFAFGANNPCAKAMAAP